MVHFGFIEQSTSYEQPSCGLDVFVWLILCIMCARRKDADVQARPRHRIFHGKS